MISSDQTSWAKSLIQWIRVRQAVKWRNKKLSRSSLSFSLNIIIILETYLSYLLETYRSYFLETYSSYFLETYSSYFLETYRSYTPGNLPFISLRNLPFIYTGIVRSYLLVSDDILWNPMVSNGIQWNSMVSNIIL